MSLSGLIRRMTTRAYQASANPVRILVVDDEVAQNDAVSALLDSAGYDVRGATSGIGAFDQVDGWVPDLVLLDISMPEYDGFATARIFRRIGRTRDVVLIAYTALMLEHVQTRQRPGDFDAYFQKGARVDALLELIEQLREPSPHCSNN